MKVPPRRLPLVFVFFYFLPYCAVASNQCPNEPAGRLGPRGHQTCPLPLEDDIGLEGDSGLWDPEPRCFGAVNHTDGDVRVNCIFASPTFRAGRGISLVTKPRVAANLLGAAAFDDRPWPLAAQKRAVSGLAYEVTDVPGKGKGVVATRRIRKGEIVMVDFPALLIGVPVLESLREHHRRRLIKHALGWLPAQTRKAIYELKRGSGPEIDGILEKNTWSVLLEDDETHLALFPGIARINHSCRPNAHYIFSPSRLAAELVAYRAIEPGEEITMSYVPLASKHEERRKSLKENWGFECSCSLCRSEEWQIRDADSGRRRIVELKGTGAHAKSERFFQDAINIAEEWAMFAETEGVPDPEPEYHGTLAELYDLKAAKTGLPEDSAMARRYARMAFDGWVRFGSVDEEGVEKARLLLKRLELAERR